MFKLSVKMFFEVSIKADYSCSSYELSIVAKKLLYVLGGKIYEWTG